MRLRRLSDGGVAWSPVPASATASGTAGDVAYDGTYFYAATAANTWSRIAWPEWHFKHVALLLNMEGANNSTIFTDSSYSLKSVTPYGNAAIKTDQYKYGSSSAYFDGVDDRLEVSLPALGTADFTVEAWGRLDSGNSTSRHIFDTHSGNTPGFAFGVDDQNRLFFFWGGSGGTGEFLVQAGSVSGNTWNHFAASRNSGSLRVFLNGTQVGSTATYTEDIPAMPNLTIGAWGENPSQYGWKGYLDQVRWTAGVGRYTSAFTPPDAHGV